MNRFTVVNCKEVPTLADVVVLIPSSPVVPIVRKLPYPEAEMLAEFLNSAYRIWEIMRGKK
jgi:hypothetical protein